MTDELGHDEKSHRNSITFTATELQQVFKPEEAKKLIAKLHCIGLLNTKMVQRYVPSKIHGTTLQNLKSYDIQEVLKYYHDRIARNDRWKQSNEFYLDAFKKVEAYLEESNGKV